MGIMYLQIIIFMAFMISKTLELEKTQRTAVVYWGVAGLSAFLFGMGIQYAAQQMIAYLDQKAFQSEGGAIVQMYYSGVTLVHVVQNMMPGPDRHCFCFGYLSGKKKYKGIRIAVVYVGGGRNLSVFFRNYLYFLFRWR